MNIPKEIDYRAFSHRVFPNSKNPQNLWRQKEYQTGKYRFTEKDKEEIKKQLLLLADEIKLFSQIKVEPNEKEKERPSNFL